MSFDSKKTAIISMDYQKGIFKFYPAAQSVLTIAAKALDLARAHNILVLHVGLGFSAGHPEVSPNNSRFSTIKQNGLFVKGTESSEFEPLLNILPDELIIYKQRYSAFSDTTLQMVLRANNIENLILLGVSTSGIVLSTLRQAFDLDYKCNIIKDACFDGDEEVHRVLTEKVFPIQANVYTLSQFEAELAKS